MSGFETVPEQHEAKRLLAAALQEGPAHAYLFHGPAGVGKRELARRFAAELLGDHARVERGSHPDLYLLEPLGEQIRIDRNAWSDFLVTSVLYADLLTRRVKRSLGLPERLLR